MRVSDDYVQIAGRFVLVLEAVPISCEVGYQLFRRISGLSCELAQVVSLWPVTTMIWIQSQPSPCGVCGEQICPLMGFFPNTDVFPCQYHPTNSPYCVLISLLSEGQTGEAWEPSKKTMLFRTGGWGILGRNLHSCTVHVDSIKSFIGPTNAHKFL